MLGLLRGDSLQLHCYLHNTFTRISFVIPSFLLADSVHVVFLPDAYMSPLVPFDSLVDPREPALVLTYADATVATTPHQPSSPIPPVALSLGNGAPLGYV